jgi:hypothetical protein
VRAGGGVAVAAGTGVVLALATAGPGCGSPDVVVARLPQPDAGTIRCNVPGFDAGGGPAPGDGGGDAEPGDANVEPCPSGSVCVPDTCNNGMGTCVSPQTTCVGNYAPVCGCDGVSYFNDCLRQSAGVQVAAPESCVFGAVQQRTCDKGCPKSGAGVSACAAIVDLGDLTPFIDDAGALFGGGMLIDDFLCAAAASLLDDRAPEQCWVVPRTPAANQPSTFRSVDPTGCFTSAPSAPSPDISNCISPYAAIHGGGLLLEDEVTCSIGDASATE